MKTNILQFFFLTLIVTLALASCEEKKTMCPICNGTGVFQMYGGIFAQYQTCDACKGSGMVTEKDAIQIRQGLMQINSMFGGGSSDMPYEQPSNNPAPTTSRKRICAACGGRTTCPVCRVTGGVEVSPGTGIKYCDACGNTHKCPWCYGTGFQE